MVKLFSTLFRRAPTAEVADLRIQLATLTTRNEDLRTQLEQVRDELYNERQGHMLEIKRFTNWYVGAAVFDDASAPPIAPMQDTSPVQHTTRRESIHRARQRFEQDLSGADLNIGLAHPLVRKTLSEQAAQRLAAEKAKLTDTTSEETTQ